MNAQLIDKLFEKGAVKGFEAQEIFYMRNKNTEISVYNGEIDKYNLSEDGGLSYRGMVNGKLGYAYTERLDEQALDMLVNEAYDNAVILEVEDEVFLHDGKGTYTNIDNFNPTLDKVPMEEKIAFMLSLEAELKAFDSRVKNVSNNSYDEVESFRWIKNTKGLDVKDTTNYCLVYAMPVVEDANDTRTGLGYDISSDFYKLSKENIIKDAATEALTMLGAKSTKSRVCPVVIKNETFAQLFSAYVGIFNAERVQKNLSAMAGKIGEIIASPALTLVDDPHLPEGLASSSFDAEGVATQTKAIIDKGLLKTYFHNLKTANKDGLASTGNASKGSYKGTLGIAPSNLILTPGEQSFDDVVASIEDGVYVVSLQGLHAGIDTISGDFSLQCHGYMIESGKIGRPVSQITVAGNYFEMLKDIEMFASDFRFSILSSDYTGSASVKIKALTISGE